MFDLPKEIASLCGDDSLQHEQVRLGKSIQTTRNPHPPHNDCSLKDQCIS